MKVPKRTRESAFRAAYTLVAADISACVNKVETRNGPRQTVASAHGGPRACIDGRLACEDVRHPDGTSGRDREHAAHQIHRP
ncbi:hypothetical protein CS0771_70240 [Catellatospora sp. IY07-71]|nr:hypothetical protein CS0771_70240 [Catellatospora sp. IY07-71]